MLNKPWDFNFQPHDLSTAVLPDKLFAFTSPQATATDARVRRDLTAGEQQANNAWEPTTAILLVPSLFVRPFAPHSPYTLLYPILR